MKKHINVGVAIALMLLASMLTFVMTLLYYYNSFKSSDLTNTKALEDRFSSLIELDKLARRYYIGDIDEQKLMDGILDGYMNGLGDPYGMYMNAEQYESYNTSMSGQFEGIGIRVVRDSTGYARVVSVMEGSPAETAGVRPGDMIIEVGGEDALELGYYNVISKLVGKEDTTAQFTVARGADYAGRAAFSVLRGVFEMKSVEYKTLEGDIGYIRFTEFNKTTLSEFELALNNLQNHGVRGVIFDVRHNGGGELGAICNVLDLLLPKGPILYMEDVEGNKESVESEEGELMLPMVVLIDEETYSAAELFAAALRDYEKAVLIGVNTFGKGTMQSIIPMGNGVGGALDLSVKMFNPPSDVNFEGVGVAPDIEVKLSLDSGVSFHELTMENDAQLQRAVQEMPAMMEVYEYPGDEQESEETTSAALG